MVEIHFLYKTQKRVARSNEFGKKVHLFNLVFHKKKPQKNKKKKLLFEKYQKLALILLDTSFDLGTVENMQQVMRNQTKAVSVKDFQHYFLL